MSCGPSRRERARHRDAGRRSSACGDEGLSGRAPARAWITALRDTPNLVLVAPGSRHWEILTELVRETHAIGNLIPEAWHAALTLEHGCEWISEDADFGRFPQLRWSRPG